MVMLMALVSVGFASCGDDEPEGADIVGTWQYDNPDETANYDIYYQFAKDGKYHYVWLSHEAYIGRRNYSVHSGTYVVSGKKLKITYNTESSEDEEVEPNWIEYSVQGNKLMLLGGEYPTFTRVEDSVIQPYL